MAAYCHLLERCEGASSPYGIVLFGDTMKGFSVPATPQTKRVFHDALLATRATIEQFAARQFSIETHGHLLSRLPVAWSPDPPSDSYTRCPNCPHSSRDYGSVRGVCGTRFQWDPPDHGHYRY